MMKPAIAPDCRSSNEAARPSKAPTMTACGIDPTMHQWARQSGTEL